MCARAGWVFMSWSGPPRLWYRPQRWCRFPSKESYVDRQDGEILETLPPAFNPNQPAGNSAREGIKIRDRVARILLHDDAYRYTTCSTNISDAV